VADPAPQKEPTIEPTVAQPKSAGAANPTLARLAAVFDWLVAMPLALFAEIGTLGRLTIETFLWAIRPPYRVYRLLDAMEFIGVQSIAIVGLTGASVGSVFSLQLVDGFRQFGAENQTGSVIGVALARELAPVFAALMVSARAGSSIATELGSMRVSSQIDALTTMSVNPVQFLIVPRVLAGILMVPVMALLFNLIGLAGAYAVAVQIDGLDGGVFLEKVRWFVDPVDLGQLCFKAAIFGFTLTLIACRQGFYATGGAEGVGRATNRAVVQSAVAVLVLDYVITSTLFVG
jgi:phospholipid/cholesterol/gamma-HCH transport system permease protein